MITLNSSNFRELFEELVKGFYANLESLKSFHFSILNPVFWLFFLVLFLILLRFWKIRKSFSFCLTTAIILLLTTKLEKLITKAIQRYGETFDPFLFRTGAFFLIAIIFFYYVFIKEDM